MWNSMKRKRSARNRRARRRVLLLVVVIPLQAFEVTGIVASGEIIELALIWKLFWFYFLCRALPLFALGIFFYWRRELGLVIRK